MADLPNTQNQMQRAKMKGQGNIPQSKEQRKSPEKELN